MQSQLCFQIQIIQWKQVNGCSFFSLRIIYRQPSTEPHLTKCIIVLKTFPNLLMARTSSLCPTASHQFAFNVHCCYHLTAHRNPRVVCLLPHGTAEHFKRGSQGQNNLPWVPGLYQKLMQKIRKEIFWPKKKKNELDLLLSHCEELKKFFYHLQKIRGEFSAVSDRVSSLLWCHALPAGHLS